jgi:hypothetical protein
MRSRLMLTLFAAATFLVVLAPAALARSHRGQGLYGPVDDKVTTNAGFMILGGVTLLIFLLSVLQRRLEKRKELRTRAKAARLSSAQWRGGW